MLSIIKTLPLALWVVAVSIPVAKADFVFITPDSPGQDVIINYRTQVPDKTVVPKDLLIKKQDQKQSQADKKPDPEPKPPELNKVDK